MPPETTYKLLDAGAGERLEQWGPYRVRRPDPRATMRPTLSREAWLEIDAKYEGEAGRGRWIRVREVPEKWEITHGGVQLVIKLAPFKHTGVFPEQSENWRWMTSVASDIARDTARDAARADATGAGRPLRILNLFAYTGGATMVMAKAGHQVTHVDASKPALAWARENAAANELPPDAVRWIQDDAGAFVRREVKRAKSYDAVVLDPPAFGRTPEGRVWKIREDLPPLLEHIAQLLENPVFVLINDYSREADHEQLADLLESTLKTQIQRETPKSPGRARAESGTLRLALPNTRTLDTGAYARWHRSS
jgi:23S rRNA (cytosine1962-C5)-methyltransferase